MYDFHLSRLMSDRELSQALAACFDCAPHDIRLIDDFEGSEQFDGCVVLAQRHAIGGDFPFSVSVISAPHEVDQPEVDIAKKLCQLADCCALIADETENPYQWVILDGTGHRAQVLVDGGALDDRDELVIPVRSRPPWFSRER